MLPHPAFWRSILISYLRLGLPSRLLPSSLPTKTLLSPYLCLMHAVCPTHLILLDLITWIFGEQCRSLSSSCLCPVTSSLLGPSIFLSTLFYSAHVSPSVWATKLHTHTKQQAKLQFCLFGSVYFWIAKWKTKDFALNDSKHSLTPSCS